MLAILLGLGDLVEPVPLAVLSGILMKVGWDIIDRRLLSLIHRIRREHLVVMLTTLALTVFVDLVTAGAIGLIVAGMSHAWQLESLELDNVVSVPLLDTKFLENHEHLLTDDQHAARVGLVSLRGCFTVASSKKLTEVIGKDIKDHEIVIFDFARATHLDDSAAMVIDQLIDVAEKEKTLFLVMALSGSVMQTLVTLNVLSRVPKEFVVETLDEAREVAATLLAKEGPEKYPLRSRGWGGLAQQFKGSHFIETSEGAAQERAPKRLTSLVAEIQGPSNDHSEIEQVERADLVPLVKPFF